MQRMLKAMGITLVLVMAMPSGVWAGGLAEQALGGALYFDPNLSINRNQSCSSCHLPAVGFDDPDSNLPVSEGSNLGLFGGRNAPSAAYAAFSPAPGYQDVDGESLFIGGQFWDGRAFNLAKQAEGPPLNDVEMDMPSKKAVVGRLAENPAYVIAFKAVYGIDIRKKANVEAAYTKMAKAIGEFERTRLFNRFNSKFDLFAVEQTGDAGNVSAFGVGTVNGQDNSYVGIPDNFSSRYFSLQEAEGLALFNAMDKGKCAACHLITPTDGPDGKLMVPALLTDFTYDNLGIPVNPEIEKINPAVEIPDNGLGKLHDGENGKFKVMSLRNIGKTAPYGHNGLFKTLKEIVHFYNTRDVANWPAPEVSENMNTDELGDLGLSDAEEDAIVAFLKTLSDGIGPSPYGNVPVPPMPEPAP